MEKKYKDLYENATAVALEVYKLSPHLLGDLNNGMLYVLEQNTLPENPKQSLQRIFSELVGLEERVLREMQDTAWQAQKDARIKSPGTDLMAPYDLLGAVIKNKPAYDRRASVS